MLAPPAVHPEVMRPSPRPLFAGTPAAGTLPTHVNTALGTDPLASRRVSMFLRASRPKVRFIPWKYRPNADIPCGSAPVVRLENATSHFI